MSRGDLIVVTPEHVEIRLRPAGLGSRFLALIADFVIILSVAAMLMRIIQLLLPRSIGGAVFLTLNFLLTWGYHVWFETRSNGRTPGKRMTGLRVVDARGLPITAQQSLVRNVVRVVDSMPFAYALGAIVTLVSTQHRRLGDLVADTLVVREDIPPERTARFVVPRTFNTLRTPRIQHAIRHRIGLDEREFLLALCIRADALEAAARYELMEDVGNFYRRKLTIDDPHLSGENLVRDLTGILFADQIGGVTKRKV
jgi:uncharacterized RDD family membrane protein YckC